MQPGHGGRPPEVTPRDTLDVFRDLEDRAEPLTASEVADVLTCSRRTALNKLHALEDAGDVESKKVGGRSRVWWRPLREDIAVESSRASADVEPTGGTHDAAPGAPHVSPDAVDADQREDTDTAGEDVPTTPVLSDVLEDLPGTGHTLDRRQDAVRAALSHLREHGSAETNDLREVAWGVDGETYSSAASLWKNCVYPALSDLPSVETSGHGGVWRYTADAGPGDS
ncbi:hypothetical protein C5C07_20050 [Haloferax sp. Atlit-4N]|uniref:winged helix-turn-helix domain-containing protein n=1 Tax=Haloferax sp. Atlit-4N TaxID=2077206 RepID=UPI000E271152|nr:helix-turn-helix domain-containing protein [Haloferax sp. Atlit-4N]RDZ49826.1 hypothetical protein C5C07_20050 [Haloferax sp. Atlit-4N]